MKKNKNIMVLEVSGENGSLEKYQRSLCQASLLGIDQVLFCCIWDSNQERGAELFYQLIDNCKSLNIFIGKTSVGYMQEIFHGPMIGKTNEFGDISSFNNLIPFEEYKSSKGMIVEEDSITKELVKIR